MNLRMNVVFFSPFLCESRLLFFAFEFPVQLGHELLRAKVRLWVAVASDAPSHRKFFVLVNDFHLIDPAMATLTTDAGINVSGVVEVHELRQVVNAFPSHTLASFPTFMNRRELGARCVNRGERCDALIVCRAVTIDTCGGGRHRCVSCIKDGVMAVPAIHLQLARVDRVAKGNRLRGLVADIEGDGIRQKSAHRSRKYAACRDRDCDEPEKWIDPSRK